MEWGVPSDDGGDPITGYEVFLEGKSYYKTPDAETALSEYTITTLTVGVTYTISVRARNRIGDGALASVSELAASVPPKLSKLDF